MMTIRTPEKEAILLAALREKPVFKAACRKARISKNAFHEWRRDDPAFNARVLAAREEGLDALEDAVIDDGMTGNTVAAIFMLKSHRRAIYGDRVKHDITISKEAAAQLAEEYGLDTAEVLAEADRILKQARDVTT